MALRRASREMKWIAIALLATYLRAGNYPTTKQESYRCLEKTLLARDVFVDEASFMLRQSPPTHAETLRRDEKLSTEATFYLKLSPQS